MKPNILFLFPDQHRGDWLPVTQEEKEMWGIEKLPVEMPNLRKIMDRGVHFKRAITPSPLCAPARACLAAGKRYEDCQVMDNNSDYPLELPTFYNALNKANYSVGGVGKFDLHKKTMWWGLDGWIDDLGTLGFTHAIDNAGKIDAGISGMEQPKDPYMEYLKLYGYREYHAKEITSRSQSIEPTELPDELYCDNWISENAIQVLGDFPEDKPWFLQVNFAGPHSPWDVTRTMREKWENTEFDMPHEYESSIQEDGIDIQGIRQNYAAMLENIDARIGDILAKVNEMGQLDNTIIVYTSDHGEMLGDFGRFHKSRPERGSIHIPLIIATPEMTKGRASNVLVELQDLANTFMEWGGTTLESADNSISLVKVLRDANATHRTAQISELKNWKTIISASTKTVMWDGEITGLYDCKNDIWEDNNLKK